MKKSSKYTSLALVKHYNFCIGMSLSRLFENFKNLNIKICEYQYVEV
jgi:hypothetical protein